MTDYAGGKYGAFQFPLSATATTSSAYLLASDPAMYHALAYLSAMITTHLGSRIIAEAAAVNLTLSSAVLYAIPVDPVPLMQAEQVKFPALAIHRTGASFTDKTVHYRRKIAEWQIHYILPPCSAGQAQRLTSVLNAVEGVIGNRIDQGADSTYTPPSSTAGASVWYLAGIDYIDLVSSKIGVFSDGGNLNMPAWSGTLKVAELSKGVAADFETLIDEQENIDVYDDALGTTVSDVAITRTTNT